MMNYKTLSVTLGKSNTWIATVLLAMTSVVCFAQNTTDPKKDSKGEKGELEDMTIQIVKTRQLTVPQANRNFDKIPPRPADAIKPPITYEFQSFSFQAPQVNPVIKPLKLKAESPDNVYGGFLKLGYGNYSSPLVEGYFNSRRDKNKLLGAHVYHNSSGKGDRKSTRL